MVSVPPIALPIAAIREQNGPVYVPHPFDRMHTAPDTAALRRLRPFAIGRRRLDRPAGDLGDRPGLADGDVDLRGGVGLRRTPGRLAGGRLVAGALGAGCPALQVLRELLRDTFPLLAIM